MSDEFMLSDLEDESCDVDDCDELVMPDIDMLGLCIKHYIDEMSWSYKLPERLLPIGRECYQIEGPCLTFGCPNRGHYVFAAKNTLCVDHALKFTTGVYRFDGALEWWYEMRIEVTGYDDTGFSAPC